MSAHETVLQDNFILCASACQGADRLSPSDLTEGPDLLLRFCQVRGSSLLQRKAIVSVLDGLNRAGACTSQYLSFRHFEAC